MKRVGMAFLLLTTLGSQRLASQPAGTVEFATLGVWHSWSTVFLGRYGLGAGARLGLWLPAGLEVEAQVDLTSLDHWAPGTRFTVAHYAGSLLFNVPPLRSVGGYARMGVGIVDSRESCATNPRTCGSVLTATGAVGFRFPLSGGLHLRGEGMIRARPSYDYRSFGGSLGLTMLFGARSRADGSADSDGDGLPNRRDRCPDSPVGALVDARGCPTDQDGDGVFDGIDRCPQTPRGAAVDAFGCPPRPPVILATTRIDPR